MNTELGSGSLNFLGVSIVIPVYEQPDLLTEALDSVRAQTFNNFEAIVVDDNSDTNIQPIVDRYGDWARLIVHDVNEGAAEARNTGIEASHGTYIAFLDADDVWHPTKLEKQYAVFEESNEELGLVYTGFVQKEIDGTEWVRHPEEAGDIYLKELERDRIHPTSTVMIRRECLDSVGVFDSSLSSRQDYDLWIRITEHYDVGYVDDLLVEKREQSDSISKNFDSRIQGDLTVFEKVRERVANQDFLTRTRVLSYHHHVIGRDYESNGNRWKALQHLALAILRYPVRPISWAMFVIALLGIDRNGQLLTLAKNYIR
ncbi:glycosyltransferase family 2 protein [Halorarum salinum]|uniref:Glycosyltransferase family 2 protein n=1 Tax=Halorarum salinum TaxID=2743089 RepID=A0A7D5QCX2_9EURY|nr:glycosyltransferase family 2 protein [Halobaculum salinum]QLG63399.1 glycosyltransferase family 2 protein [Halobaculum salinum]